MKNEAGSEVMVACRARDLRPGLMAEVWSVTDEWVLRKITFAEKRPGRRATTAAGIRRGEPLREAVPTRYKVRYEGVPGTRTLTPGAAVNVTATSWYGTEKIDELTSPE